MDREPLSLDPVKLDADQIIHYYTMQIKGLCKIHNLNKSVIIQDFVEVILKDEKWK
jgi:hypothetical protein